MFLDPLMAFENKQPKTQGLHSKSDSESSHHEKCFNLFINKILLIKLQSVFG